MNDDEFRRKMAFWAWWGMVICSIGAVLVVALLVATIVVAVRA